MVDHIVMENVEIGHRNFLGTGYFDVIIDDSIVKSVIDKGWDVKLFYSKTTREFRLRVYIDFNVAPTIFLITKENKMRIGRSEMDILGHINFDNVDLCVKPYKFKPESNRTAKACVSSMYITTDHC